ncbi:hypothetical protein BDR26DRAFT_300078 [Obelidium mucronatum]|nr:hypothetical protein BDR26DRAFT_300078 [Obelidium mucronatum]
MFHSLEFDRVFINMYNPEELAKARAQAVKDEDASKTKQNQQRSQQSQTNSNTKSSEPAKSDDPDNLKFLFDVIAKNARPDKEKDMRNLVQRLKRSRSKWAHDYRIGQEALYEALEKTLIELKNYTEHSEPFLVRVSKKDVPDYYDVIKNPMDLGTMTKKLHALEYLSKEDFSKDLGLIWSNCLHFNQQPESIYRKKAFMMKRKSQDLLKRVPDIKIIIKPQEPESESDDDEDKSGATKGQKRSTKGGKVRRGSHGNDTSDGQAAAATAAAARNSVENNSKPINGGPDPLGDSNSKAASIDSPVIISFDDDEDVKPVVKQENDSNSSTAVGGNGGAGLLMHENSFRESSSTPMDLSRAGTPEIVSAGDGNRSAAMATDSENNQGVASGVDSGGPMVEDGPDADEDYLMDASVRVKRFVEVTEEQRKSTYMSREHGSNTPFPSRPIIAGQSAEYQEFLNGFDGFCKRNVARHNESESVGPFFMPELTHFGSSYPFIQQPRSNIEVPTESLSDHRQAYPDPNSRVASLMSKNIELLRRIKEIHGRLKEHSSDEASQASAMSQPPVACKPKEDSTNLSEFVVNSEAAEAILTQCTSRILVHAGFDGIQSSALALLTDIGSQFMTNLGRTLRLYTDKNDKGLTSE